MAFDVDELVTMGRVRSVARSPGGDWLAVEVQHLDAEGAKYVSALWRHDLATGHAHPLLRGPCSYEAPCFRHDGALGFLTNRPVDGDPAEPPPETARKQVWVLPEGSEEPLPVTDEPLGVSAFRFARTAPVLVVQAPVMLGVPLDRQREAADDRRKHGPSALHYTRMPVRYWDHWLPPEAPHLIAYAADGTGRRDLTPQADREHRQASWDLSADGQHLVVTRAQPSALRVHEVGLLHVDVATGASRQLFDTPLESVGAPRLSPDGAQVAVTHLRWAKGEAYRSRLYVLSVSTGEARELAPDWDRWASPVGWSADGQQLVVHADDEGRHRLLTVDVQAQTVRRLTGQGSWEGQAVDGDVVLGLHSRLVEAPEAFVHPLELEDGAAPTVTRLAGGSTDLAAYAYVDEATTPGAGGTPVHYFVVRPQHATGPCPALIWIHGGPMSAWNDGWHWRWNVHVAVAAGYAVVLPNPRGSTGFGQDFIAGVWGNRYGAECFEDVMAVADAAAARPDVDEGRMAAMGGSFGGYMTNWIGGQSERFRCLVTHASLFDFPRFYGVTDLPAFWALKAGVDPWREREAFNRYSPHTRILDWTTPTLVIHGEKDYRVPIGEGLALFEALQSNGVESELLAFPDENHWIVKPRNIRVWYRTVLDFLGRHLEPGR